MHVWIVEKKVGEQWKALKMAVSRAVARAQRKSISGETRIRKYVAA